MIGNKGCLSIGMLKAQRLKKLFLGKWTNQKGCNVFGEKGCKGLSKGSWPNLEWLSLSKKNKTEAGIK